MCSHHHCVLGSLGRFRDAWGGVGSPFSHLYKSRGTQMNALGHSADPLHSALLLRNHAWGAASTSYLPTVSCLLSDLKLGSNHSGVGYTPLASSPGSLGRFCGARRPQDTPPHRAFPASCTLPPLIVPGEGKLEDSGATNCQPPFSLWLFPAPTRRAHTPCSALLKEPRQLQAQWDMSAGTRDSAQAGSQCRVLAGACGPDAQRPARV